MVEVESTLIQPLLRRRVVTRGEQILQHQGIRPRVAPVQHRLPVLPAGHWGPRRRRRAGVGLLGVLLLGCEGRGGQRMVVCAGKVRAVPGFQYFLVLLSFDTLFKCDHSFTAWEGKGTVPVRRCPSRISDTTEDLQQPIGKGLID